MKAILLLPLLLIACSTSVPANDAGDASVDVAAEADDAGMTGCDVQTCHGNVFLLPGQTVPNGDVCGNTCSCKLQGGFLVAQCTFTSGCPCADGSTD